MSDRMHSPRGTARRSFLTRLLRSAVTISATGLVARRLPGQSVHVVTSDDWMSQLSGKHRTVFDVAAHRDGKPLTQAKNFLDAWQTAFHAAPSDVNLVVGVHGDAIPFVVDDAMWTAYPIGALYGVTDAERERTRFETSLRSATPQTHGSWLPSSPSRRCSAEG